MIVLCFHIYFPKFLNRIIQSRNTLCKKKLSSKSQLLSIDHGHFSFGCLFLDTDKVIDIDIKYTYTHIYIHILLLK